ncbi:hypothetical protein M8C13_24795 [Crossiella sp. SN42]|uniref:DUF6779 domain-containing protein n=1 Tax=Crossiella sp. SN42 TaxID=2944808 RepID=UPI00207D080A|nr:DUF6779 domain-containing protein [Crossiella sp. SN42]MCO1578974.1 hypothetical protein [Crossiella sp. SN42]
MNGRSDSTAEPRSMARGNGILLLGAVLLLAATAAAVLVVSDDARWLRLGVVAALWAALVGAFAAARYRKQAGERAQRAEELHRVYELELECEVAARREYELDFEAKTRERIEAESRSDLDDLRKELRALRENLEALLGGEVLVERVALRAESTRMRSLPDQSRRLAISDRSDRVIASAEERIRKITAGTVEPVRAQATRQEESTQLIPAVRPERKEQPPAAEVRADAARTAFVSKEAVRAEAQRRENRPPAPQRQHVPPRKQTTPEPSRPDVQRDRQQPRREPERREPERREPEPAFAETARLTRQAQPQPPAKPQPAQRPEFRRPEPASASIVAELDGGASTWTETPPARPSRPEPAVTRGEVIGSGQVQRPAQPARPAERPEVLPTVGDRHPGTGQPSVIDQTEAVARRYRPDPEPNEPAATPSWAFDAGSPSTGSSWDAESTGRRRKPEGEEPQGRRRKPEYEEPPATAAGRRRKPEPEPEPEDAGGGRRRKPESSWDAMGGWNPELSDDAGRAKVDPDTGAHGGGGKSVSELLAAHGNTEPPRRRRRKD